MQHLEDLDDIAMCATLMAILHDKDTCQSLLSRRGPEAQSLIDLLQEVHLAFVPYICQTHSRVHQLCDDTDLGPAIKSSLLKALIELSEASCYYPQSLLLHDIMLPPHPAAVGTSSDIYKGLLQEQPVSVKVLRIYGQV